MTIEAALEAAARGNVSAEQIAALARAALASGDEARALPQVRRAAEAAQDARLWQWAGLLERAIDRHEAAIASFTAAARLAPADPSIAHGLARVTLEAGLDAVALFDRARLLGPDNAELVFGQAAARLAMGKGAEAEAALADLVDRVPMWIDGHRQLAQLRALLGGAERATESFDRALAAAPGAAALWQGLFDLHVAAERYEALDAAVAAARRARVPQAVWHDHATIAAAELGQVDRADALFAGAAGRLPIWHVRHLLRQGRLTAALAAIDAEVSRGNDAAWPYALTAWWLASDPRADWLAPPDLVRHFDLTAALPPLDQLADVLRGLHRARGEYLDQSVRGGTQTDGPLFSRIDPVIRATRQAVSDAVERYLATLPAPDPRHPTLRHLGERGREKRREPAIRFAGSWSVRLGGGGHHANHVHPQGWISSALYVALPDGAGEQGWLTIGEPQASLGVVQPPLRTVEPRPGRLVLFPSWLWHGTRPFTAGERLTIAFDVAPPL